MPTTTGLETQTQLRSAAAPHTESFKLDLPSGANLYEAEDGGARVSDGNNTLLSVLPPSAIDAAGIPVPVSMSVVGDSLVLHVSPDAGATYPIIVDPVYELYGWKALQSTHGMWDWVPLSNSGLFQTHALGSPGQYGLNIYSLAGSVPIGAQANWNYYVPRYASDMSSVGTRPTSYIDRLTLSDVYWWIDSGSYPYPASPFVMAGIWAENQGKWAGVISRTGVEGPMTSVVLDIPNLDHVVDAKNAGVSLAAGYDPVSRPRHLWVGWAQIQLSDPDYPKVSSASGPAKWSNTMASEPITYSMSDPGLGVHTVAVKYPALTGASSVYSQPVGCVGSANSPCPRMMTGDVSSGLPSLMAQGENYVEVDSRDPVGHAASDVGQQVKNLKVKVDHTKPTLTLSGTLTEQGKVGTTATQYSLKYGAIDGDSSSPTALAPLGTPGTGEGKMQRPIDVAVDNAGNVLMLDRECKCVQRYDESGKFLTQFGSAGTGPGQFTDPRGIALNADGDIWVSDAGVARVQRFNSKGEYLSTFGLEFGMGQMLVEPTALAVGPGGNLWVTDPAVERVYRFGENGGLRKEIVVLPYITPNNIAADAFGNAWVSGKSGNRIVQIDPDGNTLRQFGSEGAGNGQFKAPADIAIASFGNLLIVDGGNSRVQEFRPDGSYVRQFGGVGTASNQFSEPQGLAIAPGNLAYVADAGNKRVTKWSHATFDPQSGVASTEVRVDGKLFEPRYAPGCATKDCAINRELTLNSDEYPVGPHALEVTATDAVGLSTTKSLTFETHVVTPTLNLSGTITEQGSLGTTRPRYGLKVTASAETGEENTQAGPPVYKSSFGSSGTGAGQFNRPADVVRDGAGNLWVVDQNNNRVQKFSAAGEYISKFGFAGSGNGAFKRPTAIAVDPKGNLWVADAENHRIQKFNDKGEFLAKYGSQGSGNGAFSYPEGIAVDSKGNVYVSDTVNGRVQKFSEAGAFIKVIGSHGSGQGQLGEPGAIDIAPSGDLWVADWGNNRVAVFTENGSFVRQFGSAGSGNGQFNRPDSIDVDDQGNVWVGDEGDRIQRFDESGKYLEDIGSPGSGAGQFNFSYAMGLTADSEGNLWIADTNNHRVQKWALVAAEPSPVYKSSFGSSGTGAGQFSHPADVVRDGAGNLWVVDQNNNRVQKFSAAGEYISKFGFAGSGDGALKRPAAIAVDPKGNLWVADADNHRIQKFNDKGEFLAKYGSFGTANGQFKYPEGIAVDVKGNVWVSDTENGRLQKFSETGIFIKAIGSKGSGPGQLGLPAAIDIASNGDVWVADWGNNRVAVFTENGSFVRQFGSAGSGNGQFNHPDSIDVDAQGNVWVGDESDRMQRFDPNGIYVERFGTTGSGAGQFNFSYAMGLTADSEGNFWIADTNNNRVQKWQRPKNTVSEVLTEISVDGQVVDSGKANCAGEHCPIVREWELDASKYSTGNHSVVAKVTDGLGLVRTRSLAVAIQPDTTPPMLSATSQLFTMPDGWVEQEVYGASSSASDAGYGVTSLALKIDGAIVKSATQSCPAGSCELALSGGVDMAGYEGGAHAAELVAVDGAGNTVKKVWTINVNPDGTVDVDETKDTLEAVEAVTGEVLVSPEPPPTSPEPAYEIDLALEGSEIHTDGAPAETTIGGTPGEGFTVHTPEGPISVEPVTIGSESTGAEVASEDAVIASNTSAEVDTVIRPLYDGTMAFQMIRGDASAQEYSWRVDLGPEQYLELVNDQTAMVYYDAEHPVFNINVVPAHDATGAAVPTTLSVSGENTITLTVHHKVGNPAAGYAPFAYPIVAGSGWEGGFVTHVFPPPPPEVPPGTPPSDPVHAFAGYLWNSPPEPIGTTDGEATISGFKGSKHHFIYVECSHTGKWVEEKTGLSTLSLQWSEECGNPFTSKPGSGVAFRAGIHGKYFLKKNVKVWHEGGPNDSIGCQGDAPNEKWPPVEEGLSGAQRKVDIERCVWWGLTADGGGQSAPKGKHITPALRVSGEDRGGCGDGCGGTPNPWVRFEMPPISVYIWASGHIEAHETDCIDCY